VLAAFLLTVREMRAQRLVVALAVAATLVWVALALLLRMDVVEGSLAGIRIAGTGVSEPIERPESDELAFGASSLLESFVLGMEVVAAGAAYWAATLLLLFASGSLVVSALEGGTAALLFTTPVSRGRLLAGRVLGVWAVAAALIVYLLGAVWLVISVKTGIWNGYFLLAVAATWAFFAAMYGVVTLVSVATRSTGIALITAYGLLFISIALAPHDQLTEMMGPTGRAAYGVAYALLPHFAEGTSLVAHLASGQPVEAWFPLWGTLASGALCYAGALWLLRRHDF
jgi:ABC-type transport system involved in multi-copper enzyme maturation permease subunit